MTCKIFISYSHKDENHRKDLGTHLASLERQGKVTIWHDRVIKAGDDWKGEIHQNLEDSDIVLLLISSDFIASNYCFDVEMTRALELHRTGSAVVIPIILRHCSWKELEFSKLQATPKDAKPVSQWEDKDEAWLDVIESIKGKLKAPPQLDLVSERSMLTAQTKEWLIDTEIKLTHRRVERVNLSDVYITPTLKILNLDTNKPRETTPANSLFSEGNHAIVYGDEQMGKTALLKRAFHEFILKGYYPIYLRGEEINDSNSKRVIERHFSTQYEHPEFDNSILGRVVVLIDDIHNKKLNQKFLDIFLEEVKSGYPAAIITAQESFQYVAPEYESIDSLDHYEILGFGNLNRYELIKKWVSLGVEKCIEDRDLYEKCDESQEKLNSVVRRNIVPAKPIYLLSLLQMFEAYRPQDLELTSYGHCYQYLIYQALERAEVRHTDIDKYINILTELAFWIYKNSGKGADKFQLKDFFDKYESDYILAPNERDRIIENLVNHSILINRQGKFGFKYPYIYYFFAAKKIAESLSENEEKDNEISSLLENLHKEDCSNILIFITHHTKDENVLGKIQSSLFLLFSNHSEADLSKDSLSFMESFLEEIPELVIEHKKGEDHRAEANSREDEISEKKERIDKEIEDLDSNDVLAKVNKAFKGMELIGQIVKNRHASMKKDVLKHLVSGGYGAGLRFLSFFLSLSDVSRDEVIKTIEYALQERPNIPNEDVEKLARNTFLFLTYGVINAVIRKIGDSLGCKEAEQIYRIIEAEKSTPAVQLIGQSMRLSLSKKMNIEEISKLSNEFKSNPTCLRILKELVVQHLYMFPTDYKDKQRISEVLKIPMKDQRNLQLQNKLRI